MHVAAMQEVMLGALGGTVTPDPGRGHVFGGTAKRAVASGYVHTAENGNMYALTLDSEGMWSAMYQQVAVTVALGTARARSRWVRAEDMSWWLGSEAVDVGQRGDVGQRQHLHAVVHRRGVVGSFRARLDG